MLYFIGTEELRDMAEFSTDLNDEAQKIRALKNSMKDAPYELQLVWLFELHMHRSFHVLLKRGSAFIRDGMSVGKLTLLERDCYHGVPDKYAYAIQALHRYRNSFVHEGYVAATAFFDDILNLRKEMLALAELVHVEIDPDDMIFRRVNF